MFPIPSGRTLSVIDIADYWSRKITASPHELRGTISKAWWRGELVAANGPSRVKLLRALYSKCADYIAFAIPSAPVPPRWRFLDDGGVEIYRLAEVPLPNAQPDTWNEANCAEAFNAIAEAWDEKVFSLLALEVPFIVLTRSEFIQWIDKCKYERPTFWGRTSEDEDQQQATNETVRCRAIEETISDAVHDSDGRPGLGQGLAETRGGSPKRYALPESPQNRPAVAYAYHVLFERWGQEGPLSSMSIRQITEEANKYRLTLPENKDYPATAGGLSATVVRRALGLSE